MTLDIEINFYVSDFEHALKWFGLAFSSKNPSKDDQEAYRKLQVLIESMKYDEKMEEREE